MFDLKPCLTTLVFLSGLLEICKRDDIQWHFYEVWLSSTCELQTDLILKEDASTVKPRAHPRRSSSFENSTHLWKRFYGKNFLKNVVSCPK